MSNEGQEAALVSNIAKARAMNRDDLPKLGQWYWVRVKAEEVDEDEMATARKTDNKKEVELLLCAEHIASNHTRFGAHQGDSSYTYHVMHWDVLERTRPAVEWKEVIEQRLEEGKAKLADAVRRLADSCVKANLIEDPNAPKVETLLPAVTRTDPKQYKKALVRLKKTEFPEKYQTVEAITKALVGEHKNLILGERSKVEMMKNAMKRIDDRLFALELYAGFHESVKQIREGEPAPLETPITVRQMLRYMDEETLIAAEDGGMDFGHIQQFDEWAAANIKTVCPEPRCIVAFKVRRNFKDYGPCFDIAQAFTHMHWHQEDMKTYLLIRNGERAYRFCTELDFDPRLLPLREEFNQPLFKKHYWSDEEKEPVTPDKIEYDECMEERMKLVMHYNRITFLLQGLLDRSKVFEPHPPISLIDNEVVEQWVKFNYDEEDGLPGADPPVWEDTQAKANAKLKPGMVVYARWEREEFDRFARRERMFRRSGYYRVTSISRDRKTLKINEPWGTRWGYEHRDMFGREYGKYGEWEVNRRRHFEVEMHEVFNVETGGYVLGDYKKFLCDPYLKGAYMEWAPFLLKAERFLKMKPEEQAKADRH